MLYKVIIVRQLGSKDILIYIESKIEKECLKYNI
jgi:hypothetical protein